MDLMRPWRGRRWDGDAWRGERDCNLRLQLRSSLPSSTKPSACSSWIQHHIHRTQEFWSGTCVEPQPCDGRVARMVAHSGRRQAASLAQERSVDRPRPMRYLVAQRPALSAQLAAVSRSMLLRFFMNRTRG